MSKGSIWMQAVRTQVAGWTVASGLSPMALIVAGFAFGLAAIPLIATQHSWLAAPVLLTGLMCALAGRAVANARWQELSNTFDLIALAGVPFAFALADPSRSLAACFLLFGLVTTVAASLFAQHLHRLDTADRLIGVAAFVLACAMPQWFSLIAYVVGLAAFIAAGTRVSLALSRSNA